jgi:hypothetical protein
MDNFQRGLVFQVFAIAGGQARRLSGAPLGAVVNLILFGLFLACATSVYETNDDLMMQMIASGFHTGHPDEYLFFTNIIIGRVLRFLYGAWAGCNWYLIYLLVVHYAALTAIAFLVVSRRGGRITHSPLFNQVLEQHRLRPYSLSLLDRQDIFFLMEALWLEPFRIFYREHYGLDIRFDMTLNTDEMPQFEDCRLHLYQAHTAGDKTPVGTAP